MVVDQDTGRGIAFIHKPGGRRNLHGLLGIANGDHAFVQKVHRQRHEHHQCHAGQQQTQNHFGLANALRGDGWQGRRDQAGKAECAAFGLQIVGTTPDVIEFLLAFFNLAGVAHGFTKAAGKLRCLALKLIHALVQLPLDLLGLFQRGNKAGAGIAQGRFFEVRFDELQTLFKVGHFFQRRLLGRVPVLQTADDVHQFFIALDDFIAHGLQTIVLQSHFQNRTTGCGRHFFLPFKRGQGGLGATAFQNGLRQSVPRQRQDLVIRVCAAFCKGGQTQKGRQGVTAVFEVGDFAAKQGNSFGQHVATFVRTINLLVARGFQK